MKKYLDTKNWMYERSRRGTIPFWTKSENDGLMNFRCVTSWAAKYGAGRLETTGPSFPRLCEGRAGQDPQSADDHVGRAVPRRTNGVKNKHLSHLSGFETLNYEWFEDANSLPGLFWVQVEQPEKWWRASEGELLHELGGHALRATWIRKGSKSALDGKKIIRLWLVLFWVLVVFVGCCLFFVGCFFLFSQTCSSVFSVKWLKPPSSWWLSASKNSKMFQKASPKNKVNLLGIQNPEVCVFLICRGRCSKKKSKPIKIKMVW